MSKIEEILKQAVMNGVTSGFSLVRLQENQKEFTCFGNIDVNLNPVTRETLYDLASLTKVVGTSSRLFQLIDERKIDYETQICKIFPRYPNLQMTIGEVMLHQAGFIPDFENKAHFSSNMLWDYFKSFTYRRNSPALYSDLSYLLLGEVIEKIDQANLEISYQKHIFKSLNMTETTYFPSDKRICAPTERTEERGQIQGVVHDSKAYRFGKPAGHAGLFSNVEDISKFLQAFLDRKIFSEARLLELARTSEKGRTYGWNIHEEAGQLFHTGFTGGLICIDLKKNRALGLLSNSIYPSRENKQFIRTRHEICQLFFSEKKENVQDRNVLS